MTSRAKPKKCKQSGTDAAGLPKFRFEPKTCKGAAKPRKFLPADVIHESFASHTHSEFEHDHHVDKKLTGIVTPVQYTLCIKPNLESLEFEGCVGIRFEVPKEVSSITLNSVALGITKSYWLDDQTSLRREPAEITVITAEERVNIAFEPPLPPSPGILVLNFHSHLDELQTPAFYTSTHIDQFGEDHKNSVATFFPAQARKCFPCFDEPSYKSTFGLSFVVPKTVAVVTNTSTKVVYPHRSDKNLHVVEFAATPKMSTYLLAFAVGRFTFVEERIKPQLPCRIYADHLPRAYTGKHVFKMISRFISYFEWYFGTPFPLHKFDILVEKTSRGKISANESWGVVIFSEGNVLEEEVNFEQKLLIMCTLGNAICKQWFSNLVTPKWWSDLWLFESLARLMEFVSIDTLAPSYEMWFRFTTTYYFKALDQDTLPSSRIVEVHMHKPSELNEAHDALTYIKGAVILRMLQTYVGYQKFRQGVYRFTEKYSHGNGSTDEFWTVLEDVTGKRIAPMMTSWTKQLGCPLIRVSARNEPDDAKIVTLHQDVFRPDSNDITKRPNALWMIPISISSRANPMEVTKEVLMDRRSISFKLSGIEHSDWFKLNPGLTAFYRVKYPPEMYAQFRLAIRLKELPPIDRLGILSDVFALAEIGITNSTEVFNFLEAFVDEDNLQVWVKVDSIIHDLDLLLYTDQCYHDFKVYVIGLYKPTYIKLGWNPSDNESYKDKTLRKIVISRLLMCGHRPCHEEGRHKYDDFLLGEKFPPEILLLIYKAGMGVLDEAKFEELVRRFRTIEDQEGRQYILESLGFCRNEVVLREILEFSISEDLHREDTITVVKSVASNALGRSVVWEFFIERYTTLVHRYPPGSNQIIQILQAVIECNGTEEKLMQITDFFRAHPTFPGCERVISQSLETVHTCATWIHRDRVTISDHLANFAAE